MPQCGFHAAPSGRGSPFHSLGLRGEAIATLAAMNLTNSDYIAIAAVLIAFLSVYYT